ncbi:MAG: hypothetical protein LXA09_07195 [Gemmatimonadetes bacterium]|nr:hypothetical protein [Gemmatimonadota bacterium]
MHPDTAERLLRATGASPLFVDDVLGDLEELRAQRQHTGRAGGRWWYGVQVVRALPYAQRDGLRGVGLSHLVDWGQKATAAWVLVGFSRLIAGGLCFGAWAALTPPAERPVIWFPSGLVMVGLLVGGALSYLLLGYVAAWMERDRPMMVTGVAALFGVMLHTLMAQDDLREFGSVALVVPLFVGCLITAGGVWRVARAPRVS